MLILAVHVLAVNCPLRLHIVSKRVFTFYIASKLPLSVLFEVTDASPEILHGLAKKHASLLEKHDLSALDYYGSGEKTPPESDTSKIPLERVVKIYNTGAQQLFRQPWTRSGNQRSTGSGIILLPQDVPARAPTGEDRLKTHTIQ